jgi:hypothetical protein
MRIFISTLCKSVIPFVYNYIIAQLTLNVNIFLYYSHYRKTF